MRRRASRLSSPSTWKLITGRPFSPEPWKMMSLPTGRSLKSSGRCRENRLISSLKLSCCKNVARAFTGSSAFGSRNRARKVASSRQSRNSSGFDSHLPTSLPLAARFRDAVARQHHGVIDRVRTGNGVGSPKRRGLRLEEQALHLCVPINPGHGGDFAGLPVAEEPEVVAALLEVAEPFFRF